MTSPSRTCRRHRATFFSLVCGVGLALATACVVYAQDVVDSGAPSSSVNKAATTAETALKHAYTAATIPLNVVLPPVDETEKAALTAGDKDQPLQIGFGRAIPAAHQGDLQPRLQWVAEADGTVTAVVAVTSPGAQALRVALDVTNLPAGVELRFFSLAQPSQVFGPFTAKDMRTASKDAKAPRTPYWSPVIEADTVGIELRLREPAQQAAVSLEVAQVSHLVQSMVIEAKRLSDIGRAGSCNIDVRCRTVSDDIRASTAKMLFTDAGSTFLCTGTLMNDVDNDSWNPWFLTANHCLSTQAVADTLNTYWMFERATCGGPDPTSVIQRVGGSELLATGTGSDFTLLQLNDDISAIAGIWFVGWDSNALGASTTVVAIHHPRGDLKKWSQGTHTGFSDYGGAVNGTGTHSRIVWSDGTTEGGSSGSGLFDTSNRLRGQLHGGFASCSALSSPDYYGRFDVTFPFVNQWLFTGPTSLTNGNAVFDSVQESQGKEYKITASSTSVLKVELYGLSQDADLYVRSAMRPTWTQWDCRPYNSVANPETCMVSNNNGSNAYYIVVKGYAPGTTNYTVKATFVAPPAATQLSPTGTIPTATPTYVWQAVSGASWYYLWVNDSTGNRIQQWYTAAQVGCAGGVGNCAVAPSTVLAAGGAMWWVQTYNSTGYGPWSSGLAFMVAPPGKATLISPTGSTPTTTPTYVWQAVSGSTWYYLWVNDSTGNRIQQWYTAAQAGCPSGVGNCALTPSTALAGGAATWWIQTYSSGGYGPWSDGLGFTVTAPGQATLISPSGAIGTATPTYVWPAVSGSTWYYLWVNDSTATKIQQWFTSAQTGCASGIGNCSVTPGTAVHGASTWWIETWNGAGYGPWSSPLNFTAP